MHQVDCVFLTKLSAARMLSQHLWHSSMCPQGASRTDKGASMHTEQSGDPSSSSTGTMLLLPLWVLPLGMLPLWVAPPATAGMQPEVGMSGKVDK